MTEFESMCGQRSGDCSMYAHAHCAKCNAIVDVEPCCADSTCTAYGYTNGKPCKTCTDCVLCDDCARACGLCPHCVAYEAAIADRDYATIGSPLHEG